MHEIKAGSFLGIAQMFPFRNNPFVAAELAPTIEAALILEHFAVVPKTASPE